MANDINKMFKDAAKQIVNDCYRYLRHECGMTALQAWNKMQQWRKETSLPPMPTY